MFKFLFSFREIGELPHDPCFNDTEQVTVNMAGPP